MEMLQENMVEYKKQLKRGIIQKAYKGLMEYVWELRTYFMKNYPDYGVSGSIYYGYMDMTYFSVFPKSLKDRKLKIAIVFLHDEFRFEVWLSGQNKQIMRKYWALIREHDWNEYKIIVPEKGIDSILEYVLVDDPNFSDLEVLTEKIEKGTLKFIGDVESFLSN